MIEYNIIRSARKSICVIISPLNVITVRCPKTLSENKVRNFVQSKAEWIDEVIRKNSLVFSENAGIIEYREVYIYGKKFPLVVADKDEVVDNAVFVKDISRIKKLFINTFKESFLTYANGICGQTGIKPLGFSLKSYKSKWGCCDRNGKITLNYLLIMLPEELQRYVIIHELCHTVYFNHSKSFWRMVADYEPDYKLKRNKLKSYNFITGLY